MGIFTTLPRVHGNPCSMISRHFLYRCDNRPGCHALPCVATRTMPAFPGRARHVPDSHVATRAHLPRMNERAKPTNQPATGFNYFLRLTEHRVTSRLVHSGRCTCSVLAQVSGRNALRNGHCIPAQVNGGCIPVQGNGYCNSTAVTGCDIPAQVNGGCISKQETGSSIPNKSRQCLPPQVSGCCIPVQVDRVNALFASERSRYQNWQMDMTIPRLKCLNTRDIVKSVHISIKGESCP